MKFSASLLLAAAVGSFARPSGHAHLAAHRSLDKRMDFVKSERPTSNAPAPINSPQPSPPPASSSVPAPSSSSSAASSTPSSSNGSSGRKQFCGGKSKRATAAQIAYAGNIGLPDDYLCNIMEVNTVNGYDYTMVIENNANQDQQCVYFAKIGKHGGINGFFKDTGGQPFTLPANGKKILAFEANSQGGVTCSRGGEVQTTSVGQYAGTWIEFDFANTSNGGHSGADASCLVAAAASLPIAGAEVCFSGTCSTIHPGGTGTNAYLAGMEAEDGVGINANPGPISLSVKMN